MLVRTASEASREGGLEASQRLLSLEKIGELEASTQGPPNLGHIRLSHGGPSQSRIKGSCKTLLPIKSLSS